MNPPPAPRAASTAVRRYRFGRFEVRPQLRQLLVDGRPAHIGARAFDMLVVLIARRDRVLSRDELFELVWPGVVVEENNLRQQVSALRKVLGMDGVATVPGRGYRFVLPLDEESLDAPAASPPAVGPHAPRGVPSNLPLNIPALIGRQAELATVLALLESTHLLTLVGAGGVGKTRFALEIAGVVQGDYKDGVWFVELAPVADPALIARTVASAVGVHEEPGRPLLATLLDYLHRRELLIVLDNCEHLIEDCARFAEKILHSTSGARILATSREALGIDIETAWRVPSLRTAPPHADASVEELMEYAATRLFVERAGAASPAFRLTPRNARAVAQVCHQLDGIPLALELAAVRVKAMTVEQVADRLRDRFALLTRGSRTALQRHQTLRSLIDWSHGLLSEPERVLLRRLSVFAGGWTLEAAEEVAGGEPLASTDVLDLIAQLVEKSLVTLDDAVPDPRYRMLETIRQYGFEKLMAAGEADRVRSRHLDHFVRFAQSLSRRLVTRDFDSRWSARVDSELDNIRAAWNWSEQPGKAAHGLNLINALHRYWYQNMHWKEVVDWIERLGACSDRDGPPTTARAHSLYAAGMLATNFDPAIGRRLCEECLAMSRALQFNQGVAWALMWMGYIDSRQRDPGTTRFFAESLRAGSLIEDPWDRAFLRAQTLICYAGYEALMGRDDSVEAMVRECEEEIERMGNTGLYIGHCRALLGTMAIRRGEFERAGSLLAESLALYRAIDSKFDIAGSLVQQGFLALRQGNPSWALQLFRESLPLHRNYPMSPWVTKGLAHLLIAYAACERWVVAARLAGVLSGARGAAGAAPPELSGRAARAYEEAVARVRSALGPSAFDEQAGAGGRMTREEAVAFALAE
ncbi:MAG: helix-turn-helix transcriptional regulator [Ramlibacter sp.]|nr:helix-turn-helix transcriptional regulator [Ramlibacter sp.]